MRVFPELTSGAAGQFPWRRSIRYRTVRNSATSGEEIEYGDALFESRSWELPLADLEDAEWQAIRELFEETGGRRLSFTFVEPGSNLLAWSEELDEAVWTKSFGLQLNDGQADPVGGMRSTRLTAPGGWNLSQMILAPAARSFVASAWLKCGSSGCSIELSDGLGQSRQTTIVGDDTWRLYELPWRESSGAEHLTFRISGPGGVFASAYELQVEPQIGRSSYKRTTSQAGVFTNAYFGQDSLVERLTAPNQNSGTVQIQWTPSPI